LAILLHHKEFQSPFWLNSKFLLFIFNLLKSNFQLVLRRISKVLECTSTITVSNSSTAFTAHFAKWFLWGA